MPRISEESLIRWSNQLNNRSDSRRVDVFFYGLFMDEQLLRRKGVEPRNGRLASVRDFSLVIGQRATLVPSAGDTVHGVVFSLTQQEIESLYSEPSVSIYRPEGVIANCDNGTAIPVLCFNLPTMDRSAEKNSDYAAQLKELAMRLNLPRTYVDKI